MKLTGRRVSIFIVCFVFGLILSIQFRTTQNLAPDLDIRRVADLTREIKHISKERDLLQTRAAKLRSNLAIGQTTKEKELVEARLRAGYLPVKGPGIEVILNDSPKVLEPGEDPNLYLVHDEDLLNVLNAIKGAGAEAISVNDERILATTEVTCAGTTILTGANKLVPPFIIRAIGNSEAMQKTLSVKGGVLESLKFWDLRVELKKQAEITIPGFSGGEQFYYVKPLEEGKKDEA